MKILVDINHPAHVYFFLHFIRKMEQEGHEVLITASEKDVTTQLLNELDLKFIHLGSYGSGILQKIVQIPLMAIKMMGVFRKHQPDIAMGIASSRIGHASVIYKTSVFVFTDTEHASEQIFLFKPFANKIITPDAFQKDLGKKQVRYNGMHDLAYLHPEVYKPSNDVLSKLNIPENQPYFIVRLVSWEASHDIGKRKKVRIDYSEVIKLLESHGKVIVSCEGDVPQEFSHLKYELAPDKLHDLLNYSSLYIGEGGTMASEAAVLGVPAILTNPLNAGVFDELNHKYGLLMQCTNMDELLSSLHQILANLESTKTEWQKKRNVFLKEKINVTEWIVNFAKKEIDDQHR